MKVNLCLANIECNERVLYKMAPVSEKPTAVVDLCTRPSDSGPCKAMKIRYYFNIQTGKCEKFVYGGCQGNANNFESMDDCRTKCKKGKLKH